MAWPRDGQQHQQEHQRQRNPDAPPVHRPPEGPLVAPGHHPGHLWPGPHLGDVAGLVCDVHLGLDHLVIGGATHERDLPAAVLLLQFGGGAPDGVVGHPCGQARVGLRQRDGLIAREGRGVRGVRPVGPVAARHLIAQVGRAFGHPVDHASRGGERLGWRGDREARTRRLLCRGGEGQCQRRGGGERDHHGAAPTDHGPVRPPSGRTSAG